MLGAVLSAAQAASVHTSTATGPVTLSLPWAEGGTPKVWLRGAEGPWQPAAFRQAEGKLVFDLDPAKLGGATVMLLIDPPADMILNDDTAPLLMGLKADGKPLATKSPVDLGVSKEAPRQLVAAFRDRDNRVAPDSLKVLVDGDPVTGEALQVESQRGMVRVVATLPDLEYGKHEIVLSVRDTSPQANELVVRLRLQRQDTSDVALSSLGATVKVDSCFGGYESLAPINDGNTALPGDSCGNDIAWASAETDSDHWAEVTLPKPTSLREVTVYWAAYTELAHTPQYFEVQVRQGDAWVPVYQSPAAGEKAQPVTTARFAPTTVSSFRIFMPGGKGSTGRPKLLWIAEIQAR
jgi:hypothetical protein